MRLKRAKEQINPITEFVSGAISSKEIRTNVIKAELVFLISSFALPFLMALAYALVSNSTLAEIFANAYRYAILGGLLFIAMNIIVCFYFFKKKVTRQFAKEVGVLSVIWGVTFLVGVIFADYISLFIAPICIIGLMIALLIDGNLALYTNTVAVVAFYICYCTLNPDYELMTVISAVFTQTVGGCFLILISKKVYTRMSFFIDSLLVSLFIAFPIAFLSGLIHDYTAIADALKNGVWSFVSFLSGLAVFMVLLPIFEFFFGMYSNFRLDEICAPDAPLMAKLAKEAPGTYNHSLAMANLAQACAMAIGENAALARAGACYHDVGKLRNPICFTENQTDYNPHDDYIPEVSVSLITRHPRDGAELIRKNRLPESLAKIAEEHHGQTMVGFFLNKTRGFTDEQLIKSDFSYKSPKPSTKISGLIMIVDTVEAATRSQGVDKDVRNFTAFIHRLIMEKMDSGQFSECPLTLKDLQIIEETLVKTLPSLYHQRIKYTK
ncbi:MAG: HDIG domain-containing protein [Clostridia bacterium]|nr:HDIG domain-containing protein [Clostridia bacterium]